MLKIQQSLDFYNSNVIINSLMNGFSNSIILLGCKNCGKSTHGRLLAKKEQLPFFDTDKAIEQIYKQPFKEYYKKNGFVGLLNDEALICKKIADKVGYNKVVVATTPHIIDNPLALLELRRIGNFVCLQYDINLIVKKIQQTIHMDVDGKFTNLPSYLAVHKPKTMNQIHDILVQIYQEKYAQYETICDKVVKIKNAPIETNFELLLKAL